MTRRPAAQLFATTLLGMVLVCVCPPPAHAQTPTDGTAVRAPTASLLFLTTRTRQFLPAPEAELRAAGKAAVVAAVPGVDRAAVRALQVRHRIRSGLVIDRPFLTDLRHETGALRLMIVQLIFDSGRVLAAGRLIDTTTGLLLDAGTVDPVIWGDEGWQLGVERAVATLVLRLVDNPARSGRRALVVLPVQARGIGGGDVVTATHTLLETVLAAGDLAVTDPGVLNSVLLKAGNDPRRVDAAGMQVLADALGADRMLTVELISYETRRGRGGPILDDTVATTWSILPSFSFTARLTDLNTGLLTRCTSLYHDSQPNEGWFGIVPTRSSRSVLREASQRLWGQVGFHTEESP